MDAPTEIPPETPMQFGIAIDSFKANADGTMTVYGVVTTERIDAVNDIVDADFAQKALDEWLNGPNQGNMRGQHQKLWPAGRGMTLERDGDTHKLAAIVVDPLAQKLIKHRILKAFSIGIVGTRRMWDTVKAAWRVVGGAIGEVSFVDVPCNADTEFALAVKADAGEWKALDLFSRIKPEVLGSVLTQDELVALAQKFALDTSHPLVQAALRHADKALDDDKVECSTCHGKGKIRGGHLDCPDCDGSGRVSDTAEKMWLCGTCGGDGCGACTEGRVPALADVKAKDASVGGGVDRAKVPKDQFVFPEDAPDGGFPVVTPGDVADAVSSWGRYEGPHSFADFKKRLIAIAKRLGPKFVAELPDAWNVTHKAGEMDDDKAKGGQSVADDGGDGVTDEEADQAAKAKDADIDAAVSEDLDKVQAALDQAKSDQAADEDRNGGDDDDESEKALADTLSRLHAATCPVFETDHVAKLHPGTWAERLDITPLETLFAQSAQKAREDGPTDSWNALSGALGTLAGPIVVARHVPDAVLDEAHTEMVAQQRAEKAAGVADAVGAGNARTFYTKVAQGRHADALKAIHDAVVGLRPDVCPLPLVNPTVPTVQLNTDGRPEGVNGSVTEKSAAALLDTAAAAVATEPAEPVVVEPKAAEPAPAAPVIPTAPAEPTTEKAIDINAVVTEMGQMFRTDFNKRLDAMKAEHSRDLKALQDRIGELESAPNPAEAPLRKALANLGGTGTQVDVTQADGYVTALKAIAADNSDPQRQQAARDALNELRLPTAQ